MKDDTLFLWWQNFVIDLLFKFWEVKKQGISYNYYNISYPCGSLNHDLSFIDKIYPGKESKKTYLYNAYFNKESLDRAKERLALKKNTSVNISLINKEKTNTTQDHCMVSMVVFKENKKYKATIFYRTTELCRKFLFDLKFLKEEIFPYLDIPDCDVTFMFSKVTISYAFLHTIFLLGVKPENLILVKGLEEFWNGYLQYLNKMLLVNQRGSILKSHWRHFQTFNKSKIFPTVMKFLDGI